MIESPQENTNHQHQTSHQQHTLHYHNIKGMSVSKLAYHSTKLYEPDGPDVIVMTETWFNKQKILQSHPCYVDSSPEPPIRMANNRVMNGITLMSRPCVKGCIIINFKEPYYIHFTIDTINYLAVYFPPSLEDGALEILLSQVNLPVDVFVGDINVVWMTAQNRPATREHTSGRKLIITEFLNLKGLLHQTPDLRAPMSKQGKDHLFSSSNIACIQYSQYNAPKKVYAHFDHPVLSVVCSSKGLTKEKVQHIQTDNGAYRYNLKCLKRKKTCRKFQKEYKKNSDGIREQFCLARSDIHNKQNEINFLNEIIVQAVLQSAEKVLHAYKVNTMRQRPDRLLKELAQSRNPADIMRRYKRMKDRRKGSKIFTAQDPTKTPVEEGREFFENLYRFQSEQAKKDFAIAPPPEISNEEVENEFASAFTESKIKNFIRQYSSDKSGGADGIQVEMLKKLDENCMLMHHLSLLFKRCSQWSMVPESWRFSSIVCIPKKNTSCFVSDSRGIALTQIFRRIFEGLLLRHWESPLIDSSWQEVMNTQGGFQKKLNTYPHIRPTQDG
jgi:hypothetical protein